jgi:two-component system cell cycle sensor histidine kinase/response regulator CckA
LSRAREENELARPWAIRSRVRPATDENASARAGNGGPLPRDVSQAPEQLLVETAIAPSESPATDLGDANRRIALLGGQLERLRTFLRLTDEGIWCFEFDPPVPLSTQIDQALELAMERGHLVECNDALARMYGYARADDLIGLPVRDFIAVLSPQNVAYLHEFWRRGLRLHDGESHEVDREGRSKFFLNNLMAVVTNGCMTQVWGTQRDITERKQLESRLLQAQKMEAIGQLAGGVAHDFNNMLMVIAGNISVVLDSESLPLEDADALREAQQAAERATDLTRQLLTFSRRGAMQLEPVDLRQTLERVCQMLRRLIHESIAFELDLCEDAPRVYSDVGQVEQMLVNLALNARDAMPDGGVLRFVLRVEQNAGRPWLLLQVSDTGRGMSPETRARMFDPFFTSKPQGEGTGLGLSVVYGIVARCGGTIDVRSELQRGTTILVRLPGMARDAASRAIAPRPQRARAATVLLVEDQANVLELIQRFLRASGHRVISARDAQEVASAHPGAIDLLICDVVMPGVNGVEFARKLQERRPEIRVLLMSGYSDLPELADALAGDARFVAKPFTKHELDRHIGELLGTE